MDEHVFCGLLAALCGRLLVVSHTLVASVSHESDLNEALLPTAFGGANSGSRDLASRDVFKGPHLEEKSKFGALVDFTLRAISNLVLERM